MRRKCIEGCEKERCMFWKRLPPQQAAFMKAKHFDPRKEVLIPKNNIYFADGGGDCGQIPCGAPSLSSGRS